MQVGVGVVFAHWILFYFQYFLQLTLKLVAIFFIFIGKEKEDVTHVKFGTRTQTTI